MILYYDPDANTKTLEWMQATTQAYFKAKLGPVRFQPVTKLLNFEELMRQNKPIAVVVSSLYLNRGRRPFVLSCTLVPERKHRTFFHKVLVTGNATLIVGQLKGKSVAAVTSGNRIWLGKAMLSGLRLSLRDLRIVSVSKDIDALFALSFNQVDMALINPLTIDVLSKVNPRVVKGLRVLYRTKPIGYPPLCFQAALVNSPVAMKIRQAFVSMASHPLGRKALLMMGFDRWKVIPSGMQEKP